jgi:hypothetical protein
MQISPITTAIRLEAAVQIDGRQAVRELHQADSGEQEIRSYIAEPEADLDAMLLANGLQFLERLATR